MVPTNPLRVGSGRSTSGDSIQLDGEGKGILGIIEELEELLGNTENSSCRRRWNNGDNIPSGDSR